MKKAVIFGSIGFCSVLAMSYFFNWFHAKEIVIDNLAALSSREKGLPVAKQITKTQSVVKKMDNELPQELQEIVMVINAWKDRASSAKQLQEKLKEWKDTTIEKYDR